MMTRAVRVHSDSLVCKSRNIHKNKLSVAATAVNFNSLNERSLDKNISVQMFIVNYLDIPSVLMQRKRFLGPK